MIDDIRKHLAAVPFTPFMIRMTSGHEYPVPTVDHLWLPPGGTRVIISDDAGHAAGLPVSHISGVIDGVSSKAFP